MNVTPADIANQDQEEAQALHEAEMIAKVYERLAKSLPEDFAEAMTMRWYEELCSGEPTHVCADCDEDLV